MTEHDRWLDAAYDEEIALSPEEAEETDDLFDRSGWPDHGSDERERTIDQKYEG